MASFLSLNSEDLLSLPIEVWIQIWSFLDFDTLQKKCTRVSKKWFNEIRDSPSLSAEMKLKTTLNENTASWGRSEKMMKVKDFNAVLDHWQKLKTLHVSRQMDIYRKNIQWQLMNFEFLERIITEFPDQRVMSKTVSCLDTYFIGSVKRIFIDPKDVPAPIELANVLWLQLNGSPFDKNSMFAKVGNDSAGLKEIGPKMTNLEILSIVNPGITFAVNPNEFQLTLEWISSFKNLKELEIQCADLNDFSFENLKTMTKLKKICLISCVHGTVGENIVKFLMEFPVDKTLIIENGTIICNTSDLVQILKALGAIKNLEIRSDTEFEVFHGQDENDLDYEMTADAFERALEIISQEFPQESTDFEIKENIFEFRISKSKGNVPELIQGSESETSMDYSDDEDN